MIRGAAMSSLSLIIVAYAYVSTFALLTANNVRIFVYASCRSDFIQEATDPTYPRPRTVPDDARHETMALALRMCSLVGRLCVRMCVCVLSGTRVHHICLFVTVQYGVQDSNCASRWYTFSLVCTSDASETCFR